MTTHQNTKDMEKSEEEILKKYIRENKLDTPNRKRHKVDRRNYLFKYLESIGVSKCETGRIFNRTHATIIHGLKSYEDLKGTKEFQNNVYELFDAFPIMGYAEQYRKRMTKTRRVLAKFDREQFDKIVSTRFENGFTSNEEALRFIVENYEA